MRRWVDPSQPDLLQIATFIGYFRGVFTLLFGLDAQFFVFPAENVLRIVLAVLLAGGAYLLSQRKRLGWQLLVAGAVLPLAARLLVAFGLRLDGGVDFGGISPLEYDVIGLIFEVALLALLLHPRSRQYEKVWLE